MTRLDSSSLVNKQVVAGRDQSTVLSVTGLSLSVQDTVKTVMTGNVADPLYSARYNAAAQLYLGVEMVREAVEAFISGEEWAKAKKVARELEPRLEALVDEKYKHNLRNKGNAEQLADVDLISALDMYVEQGNWSKAIATASGHGPEVTS